MYQYNSLTSVLEDLQKRGFVYDFAVDGDCIACEEAFAILTPGEYEVDEIYRFDLSDNQTDSATIYAISSTRGLNGIVVDPNGKAQEPLNHEKAELHELCLA